MKVVAVLFLLSICTLARSQERYWEQTNGPFGGFVWGLEVLQDNSVLASVSRYFDGVGNGTVSTFRSTNHGQTWNSVGLAIVARDFFSASPDSIFAATASGMYLSTDRSEHWMNVGLTGRINAVGTTSDRAILAGTNYNGIWRSTNGGISWTPSGLPTVRVDAFALHPDGAVFAGTYGDGVYMSTDNGSTWHFVGLSGGEIESIIVDPAGDLFAADFFGGVFRSTDQGSQWKPVLQVGHASSLAVDSSGTLYAGTSVGAYRSPDGNIWSAINSGLFLTAWNTPLVATSRDGFVYAGCNSGMFVSTDKGGNWIQRNEGLLFAEVLTLASAADGSLIAGTRSLGLITTFDRGFHWEQIGLNFPTYTTAIATDVTNNLILAGVYYAGAEGFYSYGAFRSTNKGLDWTSYDLGGVNGGAVSVAITPSGLIFDGTRSNGIYRSSNHGVSWSLMMAGTGMTRVLAADNVSGDVYAVLSGTGMSRSSDGGESWLQVQSDDRFFPLSIDPFGNLYAGHSLDGVARSTDHGVTWFPTGLSNMGISSLVANSIGHIFAATDSGVYRTTDQGIKWSVLRSGLTDTHVRSLAIDTAGFIFAGTPSSGVYRSGQSTIPMIVDTHFAPLQYALSQNYPNPFNPRTTIKYELPTSMAVKMSVYDLVGREVSVLVNERKDAGVHQVRFDGTGLASGVYLYRLTAGSFVQTRKLLLVR